MTLQAARRPAVSQGAPLPDAPRFGFTLTKKVGCAVVRNRARRRLREAVRLSRNLPARADHDYVIVGRLDSIRSPFDALQHELARALRAVHAEGGARGAQVRQGGERPSRKRRAERTLPRRKRTWPSP